MSDGRYCHSTLPSEPPRDTEVDAIETVIDGFETHRATQTLYFPRLSDDLDVWAAADPQ